MAEFINEIMSNKIIKINGSEFKVGDCIIFTASVREGTILSYFSQRYGKDKTFKGKINSTYNGPYNDHYYTNNNQYMGVSIYDDLQKRYLDKRYFIFKNPEYSLFFPGIIIGYWETIFLDVCHSNPVSSSDSLKSEPVSSSDSLKSEPVSSSDSLKSEPSPNKCDHPPSFECPLTHMLMKDPVVCIDGHSYERKEIEQWFKRLQDSKSPLTNPLTNGPLDSKDLTPNKNLKKFIDEWKGSKNPSSIFIPIICPITEKIMIEPVICDNGESYEKSALRDKKTVRSRLLGLLNTKDYTSYSSLKVINVNYALRNSIEEYCNDECNIKDLPSHDKKRLLIEEWKRRMKELKKGGKKGLRKTKRKRSRKQRKSRIKKHV